MRESITSISGGRKSLVICSNFSIKPHLVKRARKIQSYSLYYTHHLLTSACV